MAVLRPDSSQDPVPLMQRRSEAQLSHRTRNPCRLIRSKAMALCCLSWLALNFFFSLDFSSDDYAARGQVGPTAR